MGKYPPCGGLESPEQGGYFPFPAVYADKALAANNGCEESPEQGGYFPFPAVYADKPLTPNNGCAIFSEYAGNKRLC